MFVKLAILLFYLRLFNVNTASRWLVYVGIAFSILFYTILCVTTIPLLPPPKPITELEGNLLLWISSLEHWGHKVGQFVLAQSIFGSISDSYILGIALYSIFPLQMAFSRKAVLSIIFGTGFM